MSRCPTAVDSPLRCEGRPSRQATLNIQARFASRPSAEPTNSTADQPLRPPPHAHRIESIVRPLVEALRGRVEFHREAPHETRVELVLPAQVPDAPSPRPAAESGGLIVVAESRADVRSILVSMLASLKYQVVAVNGLAAARAAARRAAETSLVILDEDLLDRTSRNLAGGLRDDFGPAPLLVLTAGALPAEIGCDPVPFRLLHKPFRMSDLASAVTRAIAERSA